MRFIKVLTKIIQITMITAKNERLTIFEIDHIVKFKSKFYNDFFLGDTFLLVHSKCYLFMLYIK